MADIRCDMDAWLRYQSGRFFWKAAIDRLVRHRFFVHELEAPVDLLALAEELGFHVVFDNVLAGRLELDVFPRLIRIPKSASRRRQRFALAHEIAHSLFLTETSGAFHSVFARALGESPKDAREHKKRLEEYCDVAARAILLPCITTDTVEEKVSALSDLQGLIQLAYRFDVSPIIVFHRLLDLVRAAQFKGSILLKFCVNRHSGRHRKWRVVSPVMLDAGGRRIRLWENKSMDTVGVTLPPPESIRNCTELASARVKIGNRSWTFKPQWDERESDLILGAFERDHYRDSAKQLTLF